MTHTPPTADTEAAAHEAAEGVARAVVGDVSGGALVWIVGADAADFLHRLLTCDVRGLGVGRASAAFMLSAQGRIELALTLLRVDADRFVALSDAPADVRGALDRFLFSERVELLDDAAAHSVLTIQGPSAPAVLEAAGLPRPSDGAHATGHLAGLPVRVWPSARSPAAGFDLLVATRDVEAALGALVGDGCSPAGAPALEHLRVLGGAPRAGAEWSPDASPLEVSDLWGVTEGKGCYPGQEVIERTLALGRPPRALVALVVEAEVKVGAAVHDPSGEIGRVTSASTLGGGPTYALALIKRRVAESDAALSIGAVPATRRPRVAL